jgi:hypothetical protein
MSRIQLFRNRNDFDAWLLRMDGELAEFRESVPSDLNKQLDFSPTSFDHLEKWLLENFETSDQLRENRLLWDRIGRYVGETYRRHTGGRWEIVLDDPKFITYGLPDLIDAKGQRASLTTHYAATAAIHRRTGRYLRPLLEKAIARAAAAPAVPATPRAVPVPSKRPPEVGDTWLVLFRWTGPYNPTIVRPQYEPGWSKLRVDLQRLAPGTSGTPVAIGAGLDRVGVSLTRESFVREESKKFVADPEQLGRNAIDGYVPTPDELRYVASCDSRFEIAYVDDPASKGWGQALGLAESLSDVLGGPNRAYTFSTGLGAFLPPFG